MDRYVGQMVSPLLVVVARDHADAFLETSNAPTVSVVIPTFRRLHLLRRCLIAVLAQELPGRSFEVIVVDDGREIETLHMMKALQDEATPAIDGHTIALVYLQPNAGRGPAGARNRGWRSARANVIAFTDDDTIPQPGWLEHGVRAMALSPAWSAARGRTVVPLDHPGRRPTDHELMTLGLQDAEFVTANAFVQRSALERVDGFDELFTRPWGEDSDLQFRLAGEVGEVGQCDEAVVFHPVRPERWGVCLRQQRNAYFDALLYKKHRRLYRERIHPAPPWRYYAIVSLAGAVLITAAFGIGGVAIACAGAGTACVLELAWQRLILTSRAPRNVAEMVITSAMIPFLSVYWRLRGALRFRVLFL